MSWMGFAAQHLAPKSSMAICAPTTEPLPVMSRRAALVVQHTNLDAAAASASVIVKAARAHINPAEATQDFQFMFPAPCCRLRTLNS